MIRQTIDEIIVRPAPGDPRRAIVQAGSLNFRAALGRSGRSSRKREGDGATPIAAMRILYGFYRRDRLAGPLATRLPMATIDAAMLWCDAPADANYNRPVRAPFVPSHEDLKRGDGLYDICLVMDWNMSSRRRNLGSAIFFHCARPGYPPTQGCVAIDLRDMRRLLPLIGPRTVVRVV
ncbi:MAG: L,D-transpeptidase family protein [Rhizobium sp.]|nr:L,D-transpeptidase family protein [Rhizobium sp.]MBX9459042.1 L,D-transpeptidase family protein [Rhizobium sp.]